MNPTASIQLPIVKLPKFIKVHINPFTIFINYFEVEYIINFYNNNFYKNYIHNNPLHLNRSRIFYLSSLKKYQRQFLLELKTLPRMPKMPLSKTIALCFRF